MILPGQNLPFAPLNISDIQQMYGVRIEASYQKYPTAYVPPPMISKIMTAVLDISEHQTNPGVIGMNEPTRMDYIYQVRGFRRISASHKQNCVSVRFVGGSGVGAAFWKTADVSPRGPAEFRPGACTWACRTTCPDVWQGNTRNFRGQAD